MAITHLDQSKHWRAEEVKIIGDRAVRFSDVCVHEFSVGDVEDHEFSIGDVEGPEIYAAGPLWDWQESDAGKWIMENAVEKPYYIKTLDYNSRRHRYKIMARLNEQDQTYWKLKYE